MNIILASLIFALTSCGSNEEKPSSDARIEDLRIEYENRLDEYNKLTAPEGGWPSTKDCDATLWAGEVCSAGASVDIFLAEYEPGQIHRRPPPSCFENGATNGSASTVSNDMILGYLWCLWYLKDVDALKRLADYGEANNWIMGEPQSSDRVYLKPNQIGLLGRMLTSLGVEKDYASVPAAYFSVEKDYEKHLQVLGILLNGEVDGSINDSMISLLKELSRKSDDALMHAAYGRYTGNASVALDLLLSDTPTPSYVRGHDNYKLVHWLKAASVVLNK